MELCQKIVLFEKIVRNLKRVSGNVLDKVNSCHYFVIFIINHIKYMTKFYIDRD